MYMLNWDCRCSLPRLAGFPYVSFSCLIPLGALYSSYFIWF
jgi:hypothetical protein